MFQSNTDKAALETILQDPSFFLQQIDLTTRKLKFLRSRRDILSSAAFIDGRSDLTDHTRLYTVDIDDALAFQQEQGAPSEPDRFIFHMSFCGSTLLARACDIEGKAFSYKEPQALIDLATLKEQKHSLYGNRDTWQPLVNLTLQQFRQRWTPNELTLIKPSNWINTILPDLFQCLDTSKAIFVTIEPRKFLMAMLRGGRERIAYTCSFLLHMQTAFPEFSPLIERAAPLGADPLHNAARLILVAHEMQNEAYRRVTRNVRNDHYAFLSFDEILAQPEKSLALVSDTLGLGLQEDDIRCSVESSFRYHSKNENELYDRAVAGKIDQKVEQTYSYIIDPALDWYYANIQNLTWPEEPEQRDIKASD